MTVKDFVDKRWRLLYRGSRNGIGNSNFHGKCDGEPNMNMIMLTTKSFIFSGFTPMAWDSSSAHMPDSNQTSFVFSVQNPHTINGKKLSLNDS
jgi:hypothetical protein